MAACTDWHQAAAYNPSEPHIAWLTAVYPAVRKDAASRPLECVQRAGDVLYVPAGWYHATINLGDTIAVAQRRSIYPTDSGRDLADRSVRGTLPLP